MISVVVAAQEGEANPAACLQSLIGQEGVDPDLLEIILVDGRLGGGVVEGVDASRIVVIKAADGPSLPELFGRGIPRCRGDLVALTESHAVFPADWARSASVVHEETAAAAIGGAVTAGDLRGQLDWALYLVDYSAFVLPFEARETDDLPGCNVLFERRVLPQDQEMISIGFWKTFLCRQLAARGEKLWLDPRLVVLYNRRKTGREWIRRRWVHGRCFGGMRARNLTLVRRLVIAVLAPALPPILMIRMWRRLWAKERVRRQFLANLMSALLAHTVWVAGEWVGNLMGPGDSCLEV